MPRRELFVPSWTAFSGMPRMQNAPKRFFAVEDVGFETRGRKTKGERSFPF
jgi:hypothetical protein